MTRALDGPDADALFDVVSTAHQGAPAPPGTYAVKRYGCPGAREVQVGL